ncbi:hypothetical protein [Leptodesmis sichuanensis]|uniref:hypothetical protein n=1 Tax=Leptodesmis sichuanensis TaxID=2906798 RepID=UPI001F384A6D|nr:hypothetical protein [Leptodesmis sichuanensis]UIE38884.1 hypothetical protein KIK02_04530 [Leptodesmis sichuanensis A121]
MVDTKRHCLILHQAATKFHFWRLSEDEFRQLRSRSVPIRTDGMFLLQIMLSERNNPNRLTLPKALLILERLFGKSSDWIDDWKGSFSFPLLMKIQKPDSAFFYLLRIEDHRGSLEYRLYRVLEDGTAGVDAYMFQSPVESEFSNQEINEFISLVHGFLTDAIYFFCKQQFEPFFKRIDSNHILYGYRDGAFFEEEIDSPEDYQAAVRTLEERFGSAEQMAQKQDVQLLLHSITGELLEERS